MKNSILFIVIILFGCVTQASGDEVRINDVPFLSQLSAACSPKNYLCGFASTTMLTAFYHDTTPQTSLMQDMAEHVKGSRCPTTLSSNLDFQKAAREVGNIPDAYCSNPRNPDLTPDEDCKIQGWTWDELKGHLNAGLPVIVTLMYGTLGAYRCTTSWSAGHSVVVVGYSTSRSEWLIHDPACSTATSGAYKAIPSATFRQAVHDASNSDLVYGLIIPKCIAGYGATTNSPSTFEDYLVNLRFINNCSNTDVAIQDVAISFHDTTTGNCVQKCYRKGSGYNLTPGESDLIEEQACNVDPDTDTDPCSNDPLVPGEYLLVYKLQINGKWKEVAEKSVEVLGSSTEDSFEPDNSSNSANTINSSFSQNHSILPENDEDWLKFTLNTPSNIIIETKGESGDTELWLYNDSLTQINYDDNGGLDNFSKISQDGLAAGTYFIKVDEYGNNDTISLYNVKLIVEPQSEQCVEGYGATANTPSSFDDYLVNLRFINNCSTDVTIEDVEISFHDTTVRNCVQKCYLKGSGYDLTPGEYDSIGTQACNVDPDADSCSNAPLVPGEYLLVYKLKINGKWREVAERTVEIPNSSSFLWNLFLPAILNEKLNGETFVAGALNDTGITWSGNYASGNNTACISSTTPDGDNVVAAQDCSHGRDVTHNDDSDGHAGFSYTKLDSNGIPLANQNADYATTPWACVRDNVTGLIWEVKTDDGGLHDKDDEYNWYNTDPSTNGGADGYADDDGDICYGYNSGVSSTFCNTEAYVNRVNAAGWCGASDWRMPTRNELKSLVNYGRSWPAIDTGYFPNTVNSNSYVWSGSPFAGGSDGAWYVDFFNGYSLDGSRGDGNAVRLVRGGQ